jgi:hypothetical protein
VSSRQLAEIKFGLALVHIAGSELDPITIQDDEEAIAVDFPKARKRHCAAVGQAVGVHFAYYPQRTGLEANTDVLQRYKVLAEDVCGSVVPLPGEAQSS